MTIEQAINYVYASYMKAEPYMEYNADDSGKRNPDFSKAIIEKLTQEQVPTVLVTGSKGKGSVSKMIAEILGVHGKTGMMTSPHILHFNERIQVQGEAVSDTVLEHAIDSVKPAFDQVEARISQKEYISPMGIQAAAALHIFHDEKVAFQVMECGKGVAYDDVNNVPHQYAVVNRIFLEHTRELGDTLEKIAENKSAIINGEQKAVFVSEQEPEVLAVLEKRAQEYKVPLYLYGRDFRAENIIYTERGMVFDVVTPKNCFKEVRIPLLGIHQAQNCTLAMALCEKVLMDTVQDINSTTAVINENTVRRALQKLEWPGRLEVLSSHPMMLLDACINRESCKNVLEALKQLNHDCVITIIGIPSDKDYEGVAKAMHHVSAKLILTKSQNAHYKFGPEQMEALKQKGMEALWTESIAEAIEKAREYMKETGDYELPICILGTTSLISDVKRLVARPELCVV